MISNEFKELVKELKKEPSSYELPPYIGVDKETGEPKPTPKNLKAFKYVQLFDKIPDAHRKALMTYRSNPLQQEMEYYADQELGRSYIVTSSIPDLWWGYKKKLETIEKKKERERKAREKQKAANTILDFLKRKDVAQSIQQIWKSMEPYVKKQEEGIENNLLKKKKKFDKDWEDTLSELKKRGGVISHRNGYEGELGTPSEAFRDRYVKIGDEIIPFNEYAFTNKLPIVNWANSGYYYRGIGLSDLAKQLSGGRLDIIIKKLQDNFRQLQESKLSILFGRLFKINPSVMNYKITSPYNGSEFSLQGENELGQIIQITTKTIGAGGYNIQRYHTRWLVDVRNTVTNKREKFKITDKDKK